MAGGPQNQDDMLTEINVVPLVDIVLVLLIIFMVTANFIVKPAIDLELPKADTGDRKERNQFSLLLGKDGTVVIGEQKIDETEVSAEFQKIFDHYVEEKRTNLQKEGKTPGDAALENAARNELTMVIQADALVTHGRVIHFIDEARKVGILKYAFNVDPEAAAEEAQAAKNEEKEE